MKHWEAGYIRLPWVGVGGGSGEETTATSTRQRQRAGIPQVPPDISREHHKITQHHPFYL